MNIEWLTLQGITIFLHGAVKHGGINNGYRSRSLILAHVPEIVDNLLNNWRNIVKLRAVRNDFYWRCQHWSTIYMSWIDVPGTEATTPERVMNAGKVWHGI